MKKIIFIITVLISLSSFSQKENVEFSKTTEDSNLYTSVIREDTGKVLSGVTVRVRGTGESVVTDFNGEFTVHAKPGDVLIISKDGKRINTITLNNSNFYKIDDESNLEKDQSSSKRKLYKSYIKTSSLSLLDSAKFYQKIIQIKASILLRKP